MLKKEKSMLRYYKNWKSLPHLFSATQKRSLLGLIVVAFFILPSLAACTNGQDPSNSGLSIGNGTPTSSSKTAATPTSGSTSGTSGSSGTAGGAIPLNINLIYSSVNITLLDVKQAKTFSDDTNTEAQDIVRVDLKEANTTDDNAYYDFDEAARLVLPDGSQVESLATLAHAVSIDPHISRTNWVDFQFSAPTDLSKLSFLIGKPTESQELIPLTAGTDVSKYNPKVATPNAKFTYGQTEWTVTKATSELGYKGVQANKGTVFIVVELNADNNSSSPNGGDLIDVRLKSGTTTNPPREFLNSVDPSQTGVKSTLSFIMPEGSTDFTLTFLPSNALGIKTAASTNFQIAGA
jgi:hypothetical protein